jgi:DNA-binding NtrC family response regulator
MQEKAGKGSMPNDKFTEGRLGNRLSRFHAIMRELERGVLLQALAETGVNLCEAARRLGIHRNTMLLRCRVCDINIDQVRKNFHTASLAAGQEILRSAWPSIGRRVA